VDFYLLDLKRSIKDSLIDNNTIKADIFTVKFFPKIGIIDFNDIETIIKQRVFNISPIISVKEIN